MIDLKHPKNSKLRHRQPQHQICTRGESDEIQTKSNLNIQASHRPEKQKPQQESKTRRHRRQNRHQSVKTRPDYPDGVSVLHTQSDKSLLIVSSSLSWKWTPNLLLLSWRSFKMLAFLSQWYCMVTNLKKLLLGWRITPTILSIITFTFLTERTQRNHSNVCGKERRLFSNSLPQDYFANSLWQDYLIY